ncbi:MAG: hypothetical protein RSB02_01575, partial [Anaerovoracaceae bacterium]
LVKNGDKVEKVLSTYRFIRESGIGSVDNRCYQYSKPPSWITGVYYVDTPYEYSLLETFKGWDKTIWKIDTVKGYPVLINNLEK